MRRVFAGAVLLVLVFALAACSITVETVKVAVTPHEVTLQPNAKQTFAATVAGASTGQTDVAWTTTGGAIIGSGNTITYTAPSAPGTYKVTATSVSFPNAADTATVTVTPPPITASNLVVTTNQPDGNGGYTICTNQATTVSYSFDYAGSLQSWSQIEIYQHANGSPAGRSNKAALPADDPTNAHFGNGKASYSFVVNVPSEMIPQSINIQSGDAFLNIEAFDPYGGKAKLVDSAGIPVGSCS